MNHANKNLYQIGEVTKMLGVTRRNAVKLRRPGASDTRIQK